MNMMPHSTTAVEDENPTQPPNNNFQGSTAKADPVQKPAPGNTTRGTNSAPPADHVSSLESELVADSITVATSRPTVQEAAPPQNVRQPTPQSSSLSQQQSEITPLISQQQNGQVQCNDGTQHSTKGNCYHCFQAWLRRNGMPVGGALMATSTGQNMKPQMVPYQAIYQQPWAQQLALGGFQTPFPATYGQLLRQQDQQHGVQAASSASVVPMSNLPSSTNNFQPSMWTPQAPILGHTPPPSSSRPAQTQPTTTTKHIIVDMAETCLESFPFDAFAQRHNQPPKRVREIFEAIIQMPLLRCPTDKRRAGKVATAKMKEYAQARKELQAQMGGGQQQGQQQGQAGQAVSQPQPSAWEMAQYMGPSDVPIPGHLAFPGPW